MQNKQTIVTFLSLVILACFFQGCEPSKEHQRLRTDLEELQRTHREDSLSLRHLQTEMSSINNQLNRITLLDIELHQTDQLSKMDALQKINQIENILEQSDAQIHGLEMKLQDDNPSITELGTSLFVYDKKEELFRLKEYIQELKREVEKLETQNVNLQKIVNQRENQLVASKSTIHQKEFEIKKLIFRNQQTEKELDSLHKEHKDLHALMNSRIGLTYYEEGLHLLENIESIKNNHKKAYIQRAYEQFLLAQSHHNPDAQYQIRVIKTKKKYSKYLDK
jgi:chromosome segregation ATPase